MDGAVKGDITATKWTDHHNDKRTVREADGLPNGENFYKSIKWTVHLKVIQPPQSGRITTTIKWTVHLKVI